MKVSLRIWHALPLLLIVMVSLSSCQVFFPSVMFKTPKDYPFVDFDSVEVPEYLINPGDEITVQVLTNDAFGNIQGIVPAFEGGGSRQTSNMPSFLVRQDSLVNLPIIGEVQLTGKSIPQAEKFLSEQYAAYFVDPFVVVEVTNRRVIVYKGPSSGQVITLENERVTLIEVLAKAGGIQGSGKAYRVKLVRGDLDNPQIDLIDLSTIKGMREAELIVQPNDIIYIDQRMNVTRGLLSEIAPILGLVSSLTTLYLLIDRLAGNGN